MRPPYSVERIYFPGRRERLFSMFTCCCGGRREEEEEEEEEEAEAAAAAPPESDLDEGGFDQAGRSPEEKGKEEVDCKWRSSVANGGRGGGGARRR